MPRTTAAPVLAVLALLAVLAAGLAGGGAVADEPRATAAGPAAVTAQTNTTNYLSPSAVTRQTTLRGDVDVAGAVAVGADRLHGRHADLAFDSRYAAAADEQERVAVVRSAADRTERRLATLDARQAALYRAFGNGSLSREAFVRKLTRLTAEAARERSYLQHVRETVANDFETRLPLGLDTRTVNLRSDLLVLPTPVADRLTAAVTGTGDPVTVYAQGSATGLVLSTVADGQYLRQATLRDAYAPGQPDQFEAADRQPIAAAFQRASDLYPWVFANAIGGPSIRGLGDTDAYLVEATHPHGEIDTYLHGGSADVFHELHRQPPDALPVTRDVTNATGDLRVTVNATVATGPMRVDVAGPDGDPVDATVAVDATDASVRTGEDGEAWLVQPAGTFTVSAATDDARVNVTLR